MSASPEIMCPITLRGSRLTADPHPSTSTPHSWLGPFPSRRYGGEEYPGVGPSLEHTKLAYFTRLLYSINSKCKLLKQLPQVIAHYFLF